MDEDEVNEQLAILDRCDAARLEIISALTEYETNTIDSIVNILNKPQFWLSNRFKEPESFKEFAKEIETAKNRGLTIALQIASQESIAFDSPFYKKERERYQDFISLLESWDININ